MISHQLSTINSTLILNAAQQLNVTVPTRRRRSNEIDIDQQSQCGIQRRETDMNARKEEPQASTDDSTKSVHSHSCEIDSKCHRKEISFKLGTTEPDQHS